MKKKLLSLVLLTGILTCSLPVMAAPKIYDNIVFDAEYYAANNPDVVAALGNDENALLQHYINSGMTEGRLGIDPASDIHTKTVTPSAESLAKIADTSGDVEGIDYLVLRIPDYTKGIVYYERIVYRLGSYSNDDSETFTILERTDFPDGLIDLDGNGIDDRDPINSLNVIDLNTNGIDDRTWKGYKDDLAQDFTHKNGETGNCHLCKHGIVTYAIEQPGHPSCAACKAEKEAESAAKIAETQKKYAVNSYGLGYREGDTKENGDTIYTYTGKGNEWISSKDGEIWEAVIEYGKFKGWRKWYIS